MPKPKAVYLSDSRYFSQVFGESEITDFARQVDIVGDLLSAEALPSPHPALAEVELMLSTWQMPVMDEGFFRVFPKLRAVFYAAGSIKPFITDEAWSRGVRVTSAAAVNAIPAAEFALAQITLSLKHVWQRVFEMRELRRYRTHSPIMPGGYGARVGILSLGKVGRLVVEGLKRMDLSIALYDPTVAPETAAALGIRLQALEEIFSDSDIISCHMPLLPQTTRLLNAGLFNRMKPGATFINTGRGQLVEESELVAVLRARPDLFAVLDVFEQEPLAPDSPLFRLSNVALTPHVAGSLGAECRRMGRMMVEELSRYLAGRPLLGEILRESVETIA